MSKINQKLLAEYAALQAQLALYKKEEAEMRIAICDELLKGKSDGTHTFDIDGFKVKAVKKSTISIDKGLLSALMEDFSAEEKACFNFTPNFLKGAYNKLQDKELVNQVLEQKPAMPSLTVIAED